jgi:DNA gyrase/topoisomerase IV subunit B
MATRTKKKYSKIDPIEHILHRPDMYVGSTRKRTIEEYVSSESANFNITKKDIESSPAILRIFIEPLSNAIDNAARSKKTKTPCTTIKVNIDKRSGETTIWNDGEAIAIEQDEDENCYNHSLIFGQLLTSSNYDDEEDRYNISGRNGLGVKLTNVFSKYFQVKGLDPVNKLTYSQEWTQNMTLPLEPIVEDTDEKKGYTEVSWIPDFKRLNMNEYTQDIIDLYCRYVVDAAMLTGVKVYFNDILIPVKNLKDYSKLYLSSTEQDTIYINNKDSEVVVTPSQGFQAVSFVNGVYTSLGGTHVDAWVESIFRPIVKKLSKPKGSSFNISDVKRFFRIFVSVKVVNPEFESQSKHKLESTVKASAKTNDINAIMRWSVIDDIKRSKEIVALKNLERKKKSFVKVEGLDPANNEGGKFGRDCTLILVEGLSAKTYAVQGIEVGAFGKKGRDWFGIYALRGKLLNVRNAKTSSIANNKVVADIIKALGVHNGVDYTLEKIFATLRYGKVMIITDADVDGIHISGLIQNMFHTLFPTLLERSDPFITSMQTPIVRVKLGMKELLFYDEREYKKYVQTYNGKYPNKKINKKYYKGLGTSSSQDIMDTFGRKMVEFENDENTTFNMHKIFHTKQSDARKVWLENYDPNNVALSWNGDREETKVLSISDFLNTEMIKFSLNDCKRSIPGLVDGLKESHRKTLYSCFLRNLKYTGKTLKVAQLSGYVAEKSGYHHGEQNLYDTITKMANSFIGSNNIPLLYRDGQFGCVDPNTPILMWDLSVKKAKDVIVGDKLIGDDGRVRNVSLITSGEDEMYEISRQGMDSYIVNSHHILTLKFSGHKTIFWKESTKKWTMCFINKETKTGHSKSVEANNIRTKEQALTDLQTFAETIDDCNIIDINVQEYLALPLDIRIHMKGIINKTSIPKKHKKVDIDPYILGAWLGGGIHDGRTFSSIDEDIIKAFVIWLDSVGCEVIHIEDYANDGCTYYIRRRGSGSGPVIGDEEYNSNTCKGCRTSNRNLSVCDWKFDKTIDEYKQEGITMHGSVRTDLNPFEEILKKMNLYKNKHIPHDYIANDEQTRLELLAGLIDTNGTLITQKNNCRFDIFQSGQCHSVIIQKSDIIARSLGFRTTITKNSGILCLSIMGDINRIPTRVQRKKATIQSYKIDPYCHGIHIKHIGKGKFNGWHIDGNERFLLGDSTITHNTRLSGGKDAANARYICTKMDGLTRLIFRPEDDVLLERVIDDGDIVEPVFYVPIIPMILVNGCTVGIGTGWSSNIPCYNPLDLVEAVKVWLENDGKAFESTGDGEPAISMLPEIHPWYRGFTGTIEKSGTSRYTSWGNITKEKRIKVVDELPVGMWTDSFKEHLDSLMEEKAIKSVKNYSTPKKVRFNITESNDGLSCNLENLGLHKYIYTSNMVLFTADGTIKKYDSVDEIIDNFCVIRFEYYVKRKAHTLSQLNSDIKFLGNKKRFLEEVMNGDIKLFDDSGNKRKSRKISSIVSDLEERGYDKDNEEKDKDKDDEDDEEEKETKDSSYDYLLRLQFRSITEEKIGKLTNDIASKVKARDELLGTTEKQLWLNDLDEFETAYHKWLNVIEKEAVKTHKKK